MAKENEIVFTDYMGRIPPEYYPVPAKRMLPNWYKEMNPYVRGKREVITDTSLGETSSTVKKCMPVFDALTAGYIIPLPCDVYVFNEGGYPAFKWPDYEVISKHAPSQVGNHPVATGFPTPKFISTWVIKTPPGYSCLFVPPLHHDNIFKILEGIVDTDTYHGSVEFPFQLKDMMWEGVVPAGTPMVQVIPFKREAWGHKVSNTPDEMNEHFYNFKRLRSVFFEAYKHKFWQKKEFN
jgi:hypothetical protein